MASYFGDKDIDLLETALTLFPDLVTTTLIAKAVREKASYPIESIDALKPYFINGRVRLKNKTTLKYSQVERYLPKEFFPIESERDLMCRVLIALQRGRISHLLDQRKFVPPKDFPQGVQPELLPAPSLTIAHLVKARVSA